MMKGFPIVIVESGGAPFVQVESGAPLASEADSGIAVTLVEAGAPGIVIEGGPTPPVEKPTVLTAPTITLDGYTATIALGTFEGATSEAHILLADGVPVGAAEAGELDVTAYAGMSLKVISSGTNASGTVFSPSDPVDVPASGYLFRNKDLDTAHGGDYAIGTDAATIPGLTQIANLAWPTYKMFKVRASGAVGMEYSGNPGLLVHESGDAVEVEIDTYSSPSVRVAVFGADKDNHCSITAGNVAVVNITIYAIIGGTAQPGTLIPNVNLSTPGTWLKYVRTGASTVDVYRRLPAAEYIKLGTLDASAASNYNPAVLGDYFGARVTGAQIDPLPDFIIRDSVPLPLSVGEIAEDAPTGDGRKLTVPVTYTGTPDSLQVAVYDDHGVEVLERYTAVPSPSGGSASIEVDLPVSVGGTVTVAVYAGDTDVFGAGPVALIPWIAPPEFALWLNESGISQYGATDPFRDRGWRGEWRATAPGKSYGYIVPRDVALKYDVDILTDGTGSGTTVRMDHDGAIYSDNGCAGLSTIDFVLPSYVENGTYAISLPAGLTVSCINNASFVYDSGNGGATIDLVGHHIDESNWPTLRFTVSSMTPGVKLPRPTVTPVGDAHPERVLTDLARSNIAAVAQGLRIMTARRVNGDKVMGSSPTAFALRTAAMRHRGSVAQGPYSAELAVAACGEIGIGLWWNFSHLDDDSLIAAEGAILATLDPTKPVHIEWSNELWNSANGFGQGFDVMLMGLRRGFGVAGISTVAAASSETIIDGRGKIDRSSLVTSIPFDADDEVFVDQNGVGNLVFRAKQAVSAGVTMPYAKNQSAGFSDDNFELRYIHTDSVKARQRYQMTRTKEIKAILDPIFAAAGRPLPIYVIAGFAAFGFTGVEGLVNMLDWDNGHAIKPHLALANYWGSSMGAYTDASVAGYGETQRDLAYADMAAHTTAFYAAAPTAVDASIAAAKAAREAAADYAESKGYGRNDLPLDQYEISWHVTPTGWPDQAGAWASNIAYTNKAFVWSDPSTGDGQTYRWKGSARGTWAGGVAYIVGDTFAYGGVTYMVTTAHTASAGSPPPNANCTATMPTGLDPTNPANSAYWGVFVDHNGTTWDATNTKKYRGVDPAGALYARRAFNALTRAEAFGTMHARLLAGLKANTGGTSAIFDRVAALSAVSKSTNISGWGHMESEQDNDISGGAGTNWRYKALVDFKAGL